MGASINRHLTSYSDDYFFTHDFYVLIKSYLPSIIAQASEVVQPTNHQLYKYQGDFYGLLDELGVQKQYQYATLLINDLRNTTDFSPSMTSIKLPNYGQIDQIHSTYTTLFVT